MDLMQKYDFSYTNDTIGCFLSHNLSKSIYLR